MISSLRIGVAEDEPDMCEFYRIVIPELGHRLLWVAPNGAAMIEMAEKALPDLFIVDIKMPLMDGLDAVRSVTRDDPKLVIVVSGHHDQDTMARAETEEVMGYLIKPIREADLKAAITIAARRFEELRCLREEGLDLLRREEEAKHVVSGAARALMKMGKMTHRQAVSRLQELARMERRSLIEVSKTIVAGVDGDS